MRLELTPAQNRMLAVALLISVVLGAYGLVVAPLAGQYRSYENRIADLEARLTHLRRIASAQVITEQKLAALERTQPATDYYLKSTKRALASAELQRYIKKTVDGSGGQLVSSQVMPARTAEGFASVTVKVHMRGDISALRQVLYRLESGKPVLFIDELSVSARQRRNVRSRATRAEQPLNVEFRITAYGNRGESGWQD